MIQSSSPLKTVLILRLVALLAFPAGVVLAAIMERSALMVVVLAIGMLGVSWVERLRLIRLAGSEDRPDFSGFLPGLAWRIGLLAGVFILSLGILALFRDVSLARGLGLPDLILLLAAAGVALTANRVSASIAGREMEGALAQVNAAFGTSGANDNIGDGQPGNGDIIEGEIIDRD
ncbi:hypothetical protein [Hyphomonas pacifica]|uniref:hypothetical protein n=1 Tax=Hyphomonas pacifica TaxID=1280941 RepID=UPI0011B941B9|nr:hypothetical protein [Hyphomonas pacifica]